MPGDIGGLLDHTIPEINSVAVSGGPSPLTLDNLNQLNGSVCLTSKEGIEALPSWLGGVTPDGNHRTEGATSCTIVTVDKGAGILDAFYFYFYDYNQGDAVLGLPELVFGDHVGDWEHNMVRFENGVPQAVWFSQHADGEAFTYSAVEKTGARPVVYVANGTHANYGTAGTHDHTIPDLNLPVGPLEDYCDAGTLWDPTLSAFAYSYNITTGTFTPYYAGNEPVNWLYFQGHWGDAQLPDGAPGQIVIFGQAKYVAGPTGPVTKNLERATVCEVASGCIVRPILTAR